MRFLGGGERRKYILEFGTYSHSDIFVDCEGIEIEIKNQRATSKTSRRVLLISDLTYVY